MNLDRFLVVSGVPGVHKLITSRADGVIIEDRKEGRTRFVSARQGQVTPLATVAVYTYSEEGEGTVPLVDVFEKMFDQHEVTPPAALSSSSQAFRDYFTIILPDHDRDRVHINDIKKCIKWYNFMYENGILQEAKAEAEAQKVAEAAEAAAAEPVEAVVTAKPEKAAKAEKVEKTEKAEKVDKPAKAAKKTTAK
jgi:hypothetical protein